MIPNHVVLMLDDGNSEIDAHVLSEIGDSTYLKAFVSIDSSRKFEIHFKNACFTPLLKTCSELPSNINTMALSFSKLTSLGSL